MRVFTVGDLWGPLSCEHPGCKKETHTLLLTDEENRSLPEQTGPKAVQHIFENKLGVATCDNHFEEDSKSLAAK